MQIMRIQAITNLRSHNNYQVKPCNIANYSTAPMAVDTFTPSVAFKGIRKTNKPEKSDTHNYNEYGNTELQQAWIDNNKKRFDELINNPNTDINERDCLGRTILMYMCDNIKAKDLYYFEKVLQHSACDVNATVTGKHADNTDCALTKIVHSTSTKNILYLEKLLEHPDVDTSLYFAYPDANFYHAYIHTSNKNNRKKCEEMINNYKRGVDKRNPANASNPQEYIERLLSLNEVWSLEEKTKLKELIDGKKYGELASLLVAKGTKLNETYGNIKQQLAKMTEETEKSVRESVTEQIHAEERAKVEEELKQSRLKAEQALAKREKEVKERERDAVEKNTTFDNLIANYNSLITDDVINARNALAVGYRVLYGADNEELPTNMDFDAQTVYVLNVLGKRQDKLTDTSSETPDKITKAIQDDTGNISLDGLKFLERVLDASAATFSEKDLLASIKAVKGKYGLFDMKKTAIFISNIAWKDNTIGNVIKKVQKLKV